MCVESSSGGRSIPPPRPRPNSRAEATTLVVGARTEQQLDDNLAALPVQLAPEDLAELDRASAPDWGYPYSFIGAREPW